VDLSTPALGTALRRQFVPPCKDLLFKTIFGDERNTDLLTDLLQSVLDLPGEDWAQLTLPNTHTLAEQALDKTAVLDVKVTTATGRVIDVEVQLWPTPHLPERLVFYTSKMVTAQMVRSAGYATLKQTICVVIAGFVMFDDGARHHRFVYHDPEHRTTLTQITAIHTLELVKVPTTADGTVQWQWLRFIAARTEEEMDMAAADNPQIARAATLVKHYNADETFRHQLEAREKFLHDQATLRDAVEKAQHDQATLRDAMEKAQHDQATLREAMEKAQHDRATLREALEEAHEAIEEAHDNGLLEGHEEGLRAAARNALQLGMSVEQVCTFTKLDITEITQLAQTIASKP